MGADRGVDEGDAAMIVGEALRSRLGFIPRFVAFDDPTPPWQNAVNSTASATMLSVQMWAGLSFCVRAVVTSP